MRYASHFALIGSSTPLMTDGKKRRPIVSVEELFLADEELKRDMRAKKERPKKAKKRLGLH